MSTFLKTIKNGKNTKGYVVTRVRNCDSLKTKTTQSILLDPESAKQHIRRGKLPIQALHGQLA